MVVLQVFLLREALHSKEYITKLNKALGKHVWEAALYWLGDKCSNVAGLFCSYNSARIMKLTKAVLITIQTNCVDL